MRITWTPTTIRTYFEIVNFLEEAWTEREIRIFIIEVESVIRQISQNPYMFKASKNKPNIRKAIVSKHNSLYYRIQPRKKEIELITFWDHHKNPARSSFE